MLARAIRFGTALFIALLSVVAIVLASVLWHHQTVVNQAQSSSAPEVHIDVVFVFAAAPLALAAGAATAWLLCIAVGYLWLTRRKPT